MKYIVLYVEFCSPRAAKFRSLKAAKAFVVRFRREHQGADHWVDAIIKGEVLYKYAEWKGL